MSDSKGPKSPKPADAVIRALYQSESPPHPEEFKSPTLDALRQIAIELEFDFEDVLDAFAPLKQDAITYAEQQDATLEQKERFFLVSRISSLEVKLGVLSPVTSSTRKRKRIAIDKMVVAQKGLVAAIKKYGHEEWNQLRKFPEAKNAILPSLAQCKSFLECLQQEQEVWDRIYARLEQDQKKEKQVTDGAPKNATAYFVAERIAHLFFSYDKPIGYSVIKKLPGGPFTRAVEFALTLFGIKATFRGPAKEAKELYNTKTHKNS